MVVKKYLGTITRSDSYRPSDWPANSLFVPEGYSEPLGMMSQENQERYWKDGAWPEIVNYLQDKMVEHPEGIV